MCGQVRFEASDGSTNQEGAYWRYEMAVRRLESDLAGVTAGNGAINAVRRAAYFPIEPTQGGQDIGFPFELTKRGLADRLRGASARVGADDADHRERVPA